MDRERFLMNEKAGRKTLGTVASRQCPVCGHHEIGYVTADRQFHPLKPGTEIEVVERAHLVPALGPDKEVQQEIKVGDEPVYGVWLPEALRRDRALRLKYGVMVREPPQGGAMSAAEYQRAYLEKLLNLIEKEEDIPIPVSLDRFFTAPHLASGDAAEIVQAMWRELEEIKRPVRLMKAWLERQDEESFAELITPRSGEELSGDPIGDQALAKELDTLSLEDFLETLEMSR
jgi:hypothetical protein